MNNLRLSQILKSLLVFYAFTLHSFVLSGTDDSQNSNLNYLIRSGTLSEIENTPIYVNEGITFSVGGIGNVAFDVTARLQDALMKLDFGDTPAVKNTWTTTEEYEEWSDRLILRKTTHFYVLNGSAFAQTFNGSDNGFDLNESVFPTNAVNLPNIEDLVQAYIDSGQHLSLYEEAKNAGNLSAADLIAELKQDRGPVTLIETIEFSRLVKNLENLTDAHLIDVLVNEAADGKTIDLSQAAAIKDTQQDLFETSVDFSEDSEGIVSYSQKMLNGFTVGNEWSKGITYDKKWFYVHTSAFAGFGLGLRIPWTAEVEVSKKQISREAPDRTDYEASIEVETLDADEAFYRSVGVPANHRFRGKEMPLEAGAGIALKIKVLGVWAVNRGRYDPVVGKVIDMSEDFDPPLGPVPMNLYTIDFPYETSGLAYNAQFAAVGGDFKAEIGVRGDSIDLNVSPYNSWHKDGSAYSKDYRTIRLSNEHIPVTLAFAIDDTSAIQGDHFYNFGPIYDQASYNTSLTVIPKARIRGTVYLSQLWGVLSDINISSNWHPLFTAAFSLPSLGPHAGIESKLTATYRSKRLLPLRMQVQPIRFSASPSLGIWDFTITDLGSDSISLIEYIPEGYNIVTESISDAGTYNEDERAISWTLAKGTVPDSISYRCMAVNAQTSLSPNPIGSFEYASISENDDTFELISSATRDLRYATAKEAESDLANYYLSKRPTLETYNAVMIERDAKLSVQEVKDLRPGSKLIAVENGQAILSMDVEESDDLDQWTVGGSTSIAIPIDNDAQTKFYRFKMAE